MHNAFLSVWRNNPRPTSVLVSRRSVPGVGSRHEQLWSHGSDRGERRLEDQHGLRGPQKSRHSRGKQGTRTNSNCKMSQFYLLTCVALISSIHVSQKFNPKIFKKKQKNGSSPKPSCPYCCCAVGSKDRSLSVWVSHLDLMEEGARESERWTPFSSLPLPHSWPLWSALWWSSTICLTNQ